jgi:hypothetical protein
MWIETQTGTQNESNKNKGEHSTIHRNFIEGFIQEGRKGETGETAQKDLLKEKLLEKAIFPKKFNRGNCKNRGLIVLKSKREGRQDRR